MFDFESYLTETRERVNAVLDQRLPPENARPAIIHQAMRYAVFNGGKRLRPVLCLAAAEAAGGKPADAMAAACAIEILHTYTLIHDDLPCMDDDELRRGKPTTHIAFGEANAVLAGDALLTLAFEWLSAESAPPPYAAGQLIGELSRAAGSQGVIGGQVEDIEAEGSEPDAGRVEYIHAHKTGALFRASLRLGAIAVGAAPCDLDQLTVYGTYIGKAFQITDDILNETSTPEEMGKPTGNDEARGKLTYVAVHGLDKARADAEQVIARAVDALDSLPGETQALEALARYVSSRTS